MRTPVRTASLLATLALAGLTSIHAGQVVGDLSYYASTA